MDPDKMKITFKDVAGVEEAKSDLAETIEFLKDPTKFRKLEEGSQGNADVGPPGTGKTLLAKELQEADVPFFSMSGSDFVEMFVGIGASRVGTYLRKDVAMRHASSSSMKSTRSSAAGERTEAGTMREQTLNQLLVEMDGFDATEVIIIAATTGDVLDPHCCVWTFRPAGACSASGYSRT